MAISPAWADARYAVSIALARLALGVAVNVPPFRLMPAFSVIARLVRAVGLVLGT